MSGSQKLLPGPLFGIGFGSDRFERLVKGLRVFAGPYFLAHGYEALVAPRIRKLGLRLCQRKRL